MSLRKILPRVEIRKADEAGGKYPSILRTGDGSRKGNLPIFFDDTTTIVYEPAYSASISWPSTLPLSGNLRTDFTSSIVTLGKTVKSSVGSLNNLPIFIESPGPFKEEGQHEQIEGTSDFFLTGTNVREVGFGMSSKLKSKTIIRIKLPIASLTQLRSGSASVYYYNVATQNFEEINSASVGPATDGSNLNRTYMAMDTKMFGPLGNFALSGANVVPYYGVKNVSKIRVSLFDSLQHQNTASSILADPAYRPSLNQKLRMSNYISHPFVIEKAVIEVPIEAGTSWFGDRTQIMPNGPFDNVPDAGGPAVTFGLISSVGADRRDLILSATVIPIGDNISGTITFVSNSNTFSALYGFKSFGAASAVVSPDHGSTFSGTVSMPATANVRNNLISYGAPTPANRIWSGSTFRESYIGALDPFGRGSAVEPCGRSIFGKEYTAPQITNFNVLSLNRRLFGDAPTGSSYYPEIYLFDSNVPSPYVMFPLDDLTISVSKHRPVISVDSNFNSLSVPTGSHDFKVATGSIFITLFGSLLKAGVESNDGHNPNATSNAVHEIIGADPILDEYDVFYKDELRDSYITDYVSGSMFVNGPTSRGRWRSSLDSNATVRLTHADRVSDQRRFIYHLVSFRRYAEANSTTERYYDSLVPPIDDIIRLGRYPSRLYGWYLYGTSPREVIVLNLDSNQYTGLYAEHSSNDWSRSFPFEPRYAHLQRSTIQRFFMRFFLGYFWFYYYWGRYYDMNDNIVLKIGVGSNLHNIGVDQKYPGPEQVGLKNEIAMKTIFGIGDWNNCYNAAAGSTSKLFGATDRPLMIENVLTNSYAGVEIRGWKYGLINANPQYSKNIWRRDHYGQYRDMLEQRVDTKYFITYDDSDKSAKNIFVRKNINYASTAVVTVRFVNTSGSLVRPEETYSSNLSFEATSSLPYFDGFVRNREEPLLFSRIQQFQYLG